MARPDDESTLYVYTVKELKEKCRALGLNIKKNLKKAEIVGVLLENQKEQIEKDALLAMDDQNQVREEKMQRVDERDQNWKVPSPTIEDCVDINNDARNHDLIEKVASKCTLCLVESNQEMAKAILQFLSVHLTLDRDESNLKEGHGLKEKEFIPLVLPVPGSVGKESNLICMSCYHENKQKFMMQKERISIKTKQDFACQTDLGSTPVQLNTRNLSTSLETTISSKITSFASQLPKPMIKQVDKKVEMKATDKDVKKDNTVEKMDQENHVDSTVVGEVKKASKRPYPGSTLPSHITTEAIRNSPVRPNHHVLLQMNHATLKHTFQDSLSSIESPFLKRLKRAD